MRHFFSEIGGHDHYPLQSFAAIFRQMIEARGDAYMEKRDIMWKQLERLEKSGHPESEKVHRIIHANYNGLFNREKKGINNLRTIHREIFFLATSVRERIEVIHNSSTPEPIPVGITEEMKVHTEERYSEAA